MQLINFMWLYIVYAYRRLRGDKDKLGYKWYVVYYPRGYIWPYGVGGQPERTKAKIRYMREDSYNAHRNEFIG